jgi:drug/metabolite transporter (DMT)-like permease
VTGTDRAELPAPLRAACVVIGVEALALLAVTVVLLADAFTGHPNSVGGALLVAVATLLCGAVLALCARGLWRLQPGARTPTVVLQVLAVPISYTMAFPAGRYAYGGPILAAALIVLYLLFTPPVRAVLDREPPR